MKAKHKDIIQRVILLIISLILIAFFASFLVSANIGGDAVLVFEQGIAKVLSISIGNAIFILNSSLTLVLFFVDKKKINIGTVLVMVLLGFLLQFFIDTGWIYNPQGVLWKAILTDFFAIIGLGFSLSLYIHSNIGYSPFEGLLIALHERTSWRFAYIKIANDVILFLIGWSLGGIVGIGSLMTIIMLGPLIDIFGKMLNKIKWIPPKERVSNK